MSQAPATPSAASVYHAYSGNTFLFGGNAPYVEEMYENYLANPASIPEAGVSTLMHCSMCPPLTAPMPKMCRICLSLTLLLTALRQVAPKWLWPVQTLKWAASAQPLSN